MTNRFITRLLLVAFTLLILIALLSTTTKQPRSRVDIVTPEWTIVYSEVLQQPLNCQYVVDCSVGTATRKGLDFYTCDSIITSNAADYEANDWDKGHLAPAADFVCSSASMKSTFSYLNCALQHYQLNRGVWKALEERERNLARTRTVNVEIQVSFLPNSQKLKTGATVPDAFTKVISYNDTIERYTFKNVAPKFKTIDQYRIN
jgi:DNA/RNA endonuclease G (NUC1)